MSGQTEAEKIAAGPPICEIEANRRRYAYGRPMRVLGIRALSSPPVTTVQDEPPPLTPPAT